MGSKSNFRPGRVPGGTVLVNASTLCWDGSKNHTRMDEGQCAMLLTVVLDKSNQFC